MLSRALIFLSTSSLFARINYLGILLAISSAHSLNGNKRGCMVLRSIWCHSSSLTNRLLRILFARWNPASSLDNFANTAAKSSSAALSNSAKTRSEKTSSRVWPPI